MIAIALIFALIAAGAWAGAKYVETGGAAAIERLAREHKAGESGAEK